MHKLTRLFIILLIVQICGKVLRAEGKPGKTKAFGTGLLAGGLAGAAIGHVLTRNDNKPVEVYHHHQVVDPKADVSNPIPLLTLKPPTVIENGEILPNGCYRRIIREPDQYDIKRFIETEQLICPQNIYQVPVATIQQPQTVDAIQIPVHIQPKASISDAPYKASLAPLQLITEMPSTATLINLVQPVAATPPPPLQAIVLSQKTGFYGDERNKNNAGKILLATNYAFLLLVVVIMGLF